MRRADGARALHILVVREHERSHVHALAAKAVARGVDWLTSEHEIESDLTSRATVVLPNASSVIAIDGELVQVTSPLEYQYLPGAVKVVCR
jgi:hypothetical protein